MEPFERDGMLWSVGLVPSSEAEMAQSVSEF